MSQEIQQYIRIALYTLVVGPLLGPLFKYLGIPLTDDIASAVVGLIIGAATLAWTLYGSRLNPLLERAKATKGVEEVIVRVDREHIVPKEITLNTSPGIKAVATRRNGNGNGSRVVAADPDQMTLPGHGGLE